MVVVDLLYFDFLSNVTNREIGIQYVEKTHGYVLYASDSFMVFRCVLDEETEVLDFEANHKATANTKIGAVQTTPFASKSMDGKKLFKRVHGAQVAVNTGSNTYDFAIPYPQAKITGVDIVNGDALDTVSFTVHDDASGTYSTIPYYQFNQFGYDTNISKDYHQCRSEYDADMYYGMILRVEYTTSSSKMVGFNYILNELK